MNEILAPLYYVFYNDCDSNSQINCEAVSFFCYSNVIGEIKDVFIKKLDDS